MPPAGPLRSSIPGFCIKNSKAPGVYFGGCAFLVLYNKKHPMLCIDQGVCVDAAAQRSWVRVPTHKKSLDVSNAHTQTSSLVLPPMSHGTGQRAAACRRFVSLRDQTACCA